MLELVLVIACFGGLIDVGILRRGDANNDSVVDVSDMNYLSAYLWQGGPSPPCLSNADANADGSVDGADVYFVGAWLYSDGPAPPAPGPYNSSCVADPFGPPYLGCDACP